MIFTVILFCAVGLLAKSQSVYDFSIVLTDSTTHTLQEFSGRKILIAILPITQTGDDTLFLRRIDSIAKAHLTDAKIIGICSYEDGYNDSLSLSVQFFYQSILDTSILITKGLYTHNSSDTLQNKLFSWLTHVSGNTHFDIDVKGSGQQFIIDESGNLCAVISPESKFSNVIINKLIP